MERKNQQKATFEQKLFKIPIEYYKKDMDTESTKEKKNEIIDILNNYYNILNNYYNKLSSEEEFDEIQEILHLICADGDVDLIKIYLSETIQNDTKDLVFKIDQINHTASLFKISDDLNEVVVPRTVEHDSIEYLITSICGTSKYIETLKFVDDSAVKTIYGYAFLSCHDIKEIHFPDSLTELKRGWCFQTPSLNEITISPSNGQFVVKDDKYLLGKSDSSKDEFDTLFWVKRNIEEISVPSNIKVISYLAFHDCFCLTKVEFPTNSNLQSIGECAFVETCIKEIVIPSIVLRICEGAFANCYYLSEVKIPRDSKLNTIESDAFSGTKVTEIYFPANLKHLKERWCSDTEHLTKITISPSNDQYMMKEEKYLVGKSDPSKDEFDILHFACRDIEKIFIPSNIKVISPYAFHKCSKLDKVEIPADSNLQTIGENAFNFTTIKEICIPSKVSKIGKFAFSNCEKLVKVEIHPDSNLQEIEEKAFSYTGIREIFIPPKVSKISSSSFTCCFNLTTVEIPPDSNLQTIEEFAFSFTPIKEIHLPTNFRELKKGWCSCTRFLNNITVSPLNGQFMVKGNECLVGKSDLSKNEFDTLFFAKRNFKKILIPSNIKVISENAFEECFYLRKVDFSADSNLQIIEKNAFIASGIKEIRIPSKVVKIGEFAFYSCSNMGKIDIPINSDLQIIDSHAFHSTKIKDFFIP